MHVCITPHPCYSSKTYSMYHMQHDSSPRYHRENQFHILIDLHWLPVTKRCQYKLMVLTYKTLHGTTPVYICDMLNWYHPSRPLRSGAFPSLTPSRHKTITCGRRLCDTATATIWNNLPVKLRCTDSLSTFKRQLKTHLFQIQVLIDFTSSHF